MSGNPRDLRVTVKRGSTSKEFERRSSEEVDNAFAGKVIGGCCGSLIIE